jgi:hypothetical protein
MPTKSHRRSPSHCPGKLSHRLEPVLSGEKLPELIKGLSVKAPAAKPRSNHWCTYAPGQAWVRAGSLSLARPSTEALPTRIDGISPTTAAIVLTEIGFDLSDFPFEKFFVSWLHLAPRRPISGGKQLSKRRNGTGSNRIAGALRMAALAVYKGQPKLLAIPSLPILPRGSFGSDFKPTPATSPQLVSVN